MEVKNIKYKGKNIEITKVHGVTMLTCGNVFRQRYGVTDDVEETLLSEIKELIDFQRSRQ